MGALLRESLYSGDIRTSAFPLLRQACLELEVLMQDCSKNSMSTGALVPNVVPFPSKLDDTIAQTLRAYLGSRELLPGCSYQQV